MTDRVVVNRDRSALLPPNSPQKGWRITRPEAVALGLLDSAEKPVQARRSEPTVDKIEAPKQKRRTATRKKK